MLMVPRITLADLFPCDDQTILVAKDVVDGSRRHISEVENGLRCGCVCFACGRNLIAKNGGDETRLMHHFAHRPDDQSMKCTAAGETALHILGKEIISKHGRVTMPETHVVDHEGKRRVVSYRKSMRLKDIHLEKAEGEIVPDIIATTFNGRRLFIEIKNTHACPPEKLQKLSLMDVDVLEIDVSGYGDYELEQLVDVVLDRAPRMVIQSVELKRMVATLAEEKDRREQARRREAEGKAVAYRDNQIGNSERAADLVKWMIKVGLSEYMDMDDKLPSAFLVPRRQWQAAILYRLMSIQYPETLVAKRMLALLRKRNWVKPSLEFMQAEEAEWITANIDPEFKSPHQEILTYLRRLRVAEIVHEDGAMQFVAASSFIQRVANAVICIERPDQRRVQAQERLKSIRDLMLPEDGSWVDFDAWMDERATQYGTTLAAFLQDEHSEFDALMNTLDSIRLAIIRMQGFRQMTPPDNTVGLPLDGLFARLRTARLEAEERAERERAEKLKQEADMRVVEIVEAATKEFCHPEPWVTTPLQTHDGKTPKEMAAESAAGLTRGLAVLQTIREQCIVAQQAEILRNRMLSELEDSAHRKISREDMAQLWLNHSSKELGGVKPVDFCKDEKSLKNCLELLDAFVNDEKKRRRR
ncbi:hypothetical protein ABWH89_09420 [Hoeflea alexandrii]|uniref:hypothetical protein n=1 Tax=Hoeflea alexandrii TaxID=288436 RepID=UPI0035D0390C